MKKIILLFALTFCTVTFIDAQEKVAKFEFESTVIDYGTVEKGADGLRVFKFTNVGDAPLIVSNVKSSCGCTIPKKPEAPIMPGEKGEIEVKYNTNKVGLIRKTVTVFSNADTPTVALKIKGNVVKADTASPLEKNAAKSVMDQ